MVNNTKFSVLQLSHPGLEYPGLNKKTGSLIYTKSGIAWNSTRDGGIRLWNNLKQHKRKFMRMKNVKYVDKNEDPRDYRVNSDKIKRRVQ